MNLSFKDWLSIAGISLVFFVAQLCLFSINLYNQHGFLNQITTNQSIMVEKENTIIEKEKDILILNAATLANKKH